MGDGLQLVHSLDRGRAGGEGEAEEVFELPNDEGHGDARRKARGDGVGDEPDERSQLEEAHQHEQHAGDDGGCDEAVHAVGCHDACNDGGERRRGARDLHAAAAEERDEEPGDDGRVKALLRTHARSDGQRDGKGQRHHGHHDARDDVFGKLSLELFAVGVLDDAEKYRFDLVALQCSALPCRRFCSVRAKKRSARIDRAERKRILCGWIRFCASPLYCKITRGQQIGEMRSIDKG